MKNRSIKNGAANRTAKTAPEITDTESGNIHEFVEVYSFAIDPQVSEPNCLWRHGERWYIGDTPQQAKQVTVREAMDWYVRCRQHENSSSGDISPLVSVASHMLLEKQTPEPQRTVPVTAQVNARDYGILAEASLALGCSIEQALSMFIRGTDSLTGWSNRNFATD